jgi:hypothetical protein
VLASRHATALALGGLNGLEHRKATGGRAVAERGRAAGGEGQEAYNSIRA